MPRFFFDTDDGSSRNRDREGDVLTDYDDAQQMALKCLYDMVGDRVSGDTERRDCTVDMRDADGNVVFCASMSLHIRRFE